MCLRGSANDTGFNEEIPEIMRNILPTVLQVNPALRTSWALDKQAVLGAVGILFINSMMLAQPYLGFQEGPDASRQEELGICILCKS